MMFRRAAGLAAAAMLSACATTAPPAPAAAACPPPPALALNNAELVQYHGCIASLPAADITKEYDVVNTQFSKTGSDSDRIKLAMLLALPDTPFHSTPGALALLTPWPAAKAAARSDLRQLGGLLSTLLAQQRRAEDTASDLATALAAEKARAAFLQKKIDAIKNLEINPHGAEP